MYTVQQASFNARHMAHLQCEPILTVWSFNVMLLLLYFLFTFTVFWYSQYLNQSGLLICVTSFDLDGTSVGGADAELYGGAMLTHNSPIS